MTAVRRAVEDAARSSMDVVLAGGPERFALASWRDWFPQLGVADRSFLGLRASRPTGPGDDRWQPCALLDPFEVPGPTDPFDAQEYLAACRLHYGIGHWMRADPAQEVDVTAMFVGDHGPRRPGRMVGVKPGSKERAAARRGRRGRDESAGDQEP